MLLFYQGLLKRMQVIEQSMKLQRSWQTRSNGIAKAYQEFNDDFAALKCFAGSAPCQPIECRYVLELGLQVQVCAMPPIDVPAAGRRLSKM